jgi:ABC-type antimicrobial peptide transport system permease subunit
MILYSQSASTSVARVIAQTRTAVEAIDPDLPVMYATSVAEFIDGALIFFDLSATMLFVFGTTGMVLAALGTYGLVSYTVKQSTHEIGIRMALGATALSVVRQFLARGLRLGAAGALLGVVAALGLGRILESALFGVTATDAVSFARALAIVLAGVIAATLVPAWRAARTDALSALRHQ